MSPAEAWFALSLFGGALLQAGLYLAAIAGAVWLAKRIFPCRGDDR